MNMVILPLRLTINARFLLCRPLFHGKLVHDKSQIRRHNPTRPLHVTSLQESFLFYYCVPRK